MHKQDRRKYKMIEEYSEEIDPIVDAIYIKSVKVNLNKYDVNGGLGVANLYGRHVQKSIIFPVAKINYEGDSRVDNVKYNRTIDLKAASLTATNYEGVGCGMTYFIVSNSIAYSLYDINGRFVKHISIAKYGKIICLGALSFITKSDSGIIHIWSSAGICSDDIPSTPENQKRYSWQRGKLIKKSESYCQTAPTDKDLYF